MSTIMIFFLYDKSIISRYRLEKVISSLLLELKEYLKLIRTCKFDQVFREVTYSTCTCVAASERVRRARGIFASRDTMCVASCSRRVSRGIRDDNACEQTRELPLSPSSSSSFSFIPCLYACIKGHVRLVRERSTLRRRSRPEVHSANISANRDTASRRLPHTSPFLLPLPSPSR